MRRRGSIRARLTAAHAALLVAVTAVLLGMSWWLIGRHLERTLAPAAADAVMARLGLQYVLGLAGAALVAVGVGWAVAGRALTPIRAIAATARRISEDRLDARVRHAGPPDELADLADAFDAMLDRVAASVEGQRRFVANAGHELRTPLTVMRTEAEVALDDPDASVEDLREVARAVVETTDRTEALLESLLLLAVSTSATRRDDPVDLAAVARDAARPVGPPLPLSLEPVTVRGDDVLLERLVANLVENAVRHGTDPRVHVGPDGPDAVVEVRNDGLPIDPALVARLAEPFERGGRRRGGGAGLGLSIVRAIAEAHGGRLVLQAPADGGLVAQVRLPRRGDGEMTSGGVPSRTWRTSSSPSAPTTT